jgi:hypothetical protein
LRKFGRTEAKGATAAVASIDDAAALQAAFTGAIGKLHLMEQAFADLPALTSIRAAWFMEHYAGLIASARATGALPSMLAPLDRAFPWSPSTISAPSQRNGCRPHGRASTRK